MGFLKINTTPPSPNIQTDSKLSLTEKWLVPIFSFLLALSFGLSYGNVGGNHTTYLINGLRANSPDLLSHDWWSTDTFHYHSTFKFITSVFDSLGILPWGLATLNLLFLTLSLVVVYNICRIINHKYSLLSWFVVLFFFVWIGRTETIAVTYLFSTEFQPSTIATFFFILAFQLFLTGKYLASGTSLLAAGFFHANFLVLSFPLFALAHLLLGKEQLFKRSFQQLTLPLVLFLLQLPSILSVAVSDLPAEQILHARMIFMQIAVPFHYYPLSYIENFLLFGAWHLLALVCLLILPADKIIKLRLSGLYISHLLLIVVATLLTTLVFVPVVSQLFFWRLAPFSLLLAFIIIGSVSSAMILSTDRYPVGHARYWQLVYVLIAFVILLRINIYFWPLSDIHITSLVVLAVIASLVWIIKSRSNLATSQNGTKWLNYSAIITVLFAMLLTIPNVVSDKNYNLIYLNQAAKQDKELYDWVATTDTEAIFLVPPSLETFRLHGKRAIIVDWKAIPFRPEKILEWYQRIIDISCGNKPDSVRRADLFYKAMDRACLTSLKNKYQFDYIVFYNTKTSAENMPGQIVFKNDTFIVYKLPSGQ